MMISDAKLLTLMKTDDKITQELVSEIFRLRTEVEKYRLARNQMAFAIEDVRRAIKRF